MRPLKRLNPNYKNIEYVRFYWNPVDGESVEMLVSPEGDIKEFIDDIQVDLMQRFGSRIQMRTSKLREFYSGGLNTDNLGFKCTFPDGSVLRVDVFDLKLKKCSPDGAMAELFKHISIED